MRYSTNISKALHIEAFIWQTTYESDFLSQITRILDSYFFPGFPSCGVPGLYPWSHSLFCFHQWPFLCSSSQLNCSLCWYNHLYSRHWCLTGFNLHFKSVSTWKTRVSKTLKTKSMITHSNTKVTGSTMELSVEGNQVEHVPSFHFSWLLWGRKVTEYLRKLHKSLFVVVLNITLCLLDVNISVVRTTALDKGQERHYLWKACLYRLQLVHFVAYQLTIFAALPRTMDRSNVKLSEGVKCLF